MFGVYQGMTEIQDLKKRITIYKMEVESLNAHILAIEEQRDCFLKRYEELRDK